MLKSKVISVFKTFSAEEVKKFRNYVNSPFHNTNRNVIKLFEIIKKQYPDFNSSQLSKESIFKKLYPGKKYSDIVMRILISDMLKLEEQFLAYLRYEKEYLAEKRYLLEELEDRKLEGLFKRHIKEAEQYLNAEGRINYSYFLHRFDLESAKVNYLIATDKYDRSSETLAGQGEYLVDFFLVNGLNILQELNEHKEVLNSRFDFSLLEIFFSNLNIDNIINELKQKNYKYYPIIEIYYYIYNFYDNIDNSEYYFKLKDSIVNNLHLFDAKEKYNLFLGLESCLVNRVRVGIANSNNELMDVYELMMQKGLFSEPNKKFMQANLFRNIFYTAVILKRFEWAEKFVIDHSDHLLPEQQPDMINYANALLNFERGLPDKALEFISKVNYSFFVFKYEAKILTLKIYYELKAYEPALSLIDTFSHFLTKNKNVPEIYKEPFMKFSKYLKLLIKNKTNTGNNKYISAELLLMVDNSSHFISKRWVLEKIKEFDN